MTLYLKWGGIGLVTAGALLISREYERHLERRLSEYRGILSLVSHAESEISKYLAYGRELWRDFGDEALEKCGLLSLLREGESLKTAFEKTKGRLSLARPVKDKLSACFGELGRGYKESEITTLRHIKEELLADFKIEEAEAEKNAKIAKALLLGGALTVAIMGA